ncbi:MAG: hypothetical protein HAW67_00200 [Endozoicomonadaceae bacterium]|nr:hypothetical protein [Endozoicomonadaceae bacterium]
MSKLKFLRDATVNGKIFVKGQEISADTYTNSGNFVNTQKDLGLWTDVSSADKGQSKPQGIEAVVANGIERDTKAKKTK